MVVIVRRLWRTCRHPCFVFCVLAACCLALTVLSRLWDYRRWVSSNGRRVSTVPATDATVVAAQTVPPDAVVAWNWNSSATITGLDDIFISVKTTGKYHNSRIGLLLKTWLTLAQKQTYIFTDTDDDALNRSTENHLVNTKCSSRHVFYGLCCKMSSEFEFFIRSKKRWFCHVDDDTYLNVVALVKLLRQYPHYEDWYIGKPSISKPLTSRIKPHSQQATYWFATGGAGICLSRSLALKMVPYVIGGKFMAQCNSIVLPDDCTIGFIIYHYLHRNLTVIKQFSSHLEFLRSIHVEQLPTQITFSYNAERQSNVVDVSGFNATYDSTRFLTVHCVLYPHSDDACQSVQSSVLPKSWIKEKMDVLAVNVRVKNL